MKLREYIELKEKGFHVWNAIDEFKEGKTTNVEELLQEAKEVIMEYGDITQTLIENINITKAIERGGIE